MRAWPRLYSSSFSRNEAIRRTSALVLLTLWDWVSTASTRFVADQSYWAILLASITTALWWFAVRYCSDVRLAPLFIIAAALGTYLGTVYP